MNQEKIGKYIAKKRKEKNMTQEEVASKLNITYKAISRWENGHGLPDISLMQPLCEILDITINELLNGKDANTQEGILDYMKYQNKKNNKLLLIILLSLTIFIISILSLFFINNYKSIKVYKLYGESENFEYKNGLFIKSNINNILREGSLIIKNTNIKKENIKKITLKCEDETIISTNNINNYYNNINIEKNGYNELFNKKIINRINNWYIEIIYINNNEQYSESIKLNNEIILENNKFITTKEKNISINNNNKEESSKLDSLIEKGFVQQEDHDYLLEYIINNNEKITIRKDLSQIIYTNKDYIVYSDFTGLSHHFISINEDYDFIYETDKENLICNTKCPNNTKDIINTYIEIYNDIFNVE